MGFREIGGQKTYYKPAECKKGQVLVEGIFQREFEGKFGTQYEYLNDTGEVVVLNGSGQLKYKMDFIKPKTRVKVVYDGEYKLEKGRFAGKMCHQFIVMADEDYEVEATTEEEAMDEFEAL